MSSEVKHYWPEEIVGTGELVVYLQDYAALEAECERLKAKQHGGAEQSAPAGERETIRAVFLRNGFTIKEGQTDLKPYVYAAAEELLSIARASWQRTQSAGVPEGWRLVPVEPTPEMAAQTAYDGTQYSDPFDFDDFRKDYAAMLAAAPVMQVPLQTLAHPAITHCDNCGCDWLDNGLNPIGCPYCKQSAPDVTQLVMALKAAQKEAVYGLNHARTNIQASAALGRVSAIVDAVLAAHRQEGEV